MSSTCGNSLLKDTVTGNLARPKQLFRVFILASLALVFSFYNLPSNSTLSGLQTPFILPMLASAATPSRFFAYADLSKGKFLVAGPNIEDPRFSEAVIFLVDHGPGGAVGLVINRPTETTLSSIFPEIDALKNRPDTVFFGGPVRTDQMFMLVRSSTKPEDSYQVLGNVYVSGSKALLIDMIGKKDAGRKFRIYAGYAGWGAQQLEREIARGDWYVVSADAETIFEKKPSLIWPELFRRGSAQWVRAVTPDMVRARIGA